MISGEQVLWAAYVATAETRAEVAAARARAEAIAAAMRPAIDAIRVALAPAIRAAAEEQAKLARTLGLG